MDLVARRHHVVDGDRLEVHRLASIVRCLPRKYWLPSSTSERSSSCVSCAPESLARLDAHDLQQALHEQVDEPHDRRRRLEQRRQRVAHDRRDAVGMRGADHLGRDLREHQDQRTRSRPCPAPAPLAFAEQALRDHRGQRGGGRGDQRVAEQDDAQQLVGLSPAAPARAWRRARRAARGASGGSG